MTAFEKCKAKFDSTPIKFLGFKGLDPNAKITFLPNDGPDWVHVNIDAKQFGDAVPSLSYTVQGPTRRMYWITGAQYDAMTEYEVQMAALIVVSGYIVKDQVSMFGGEKYAWSN